MIYFDNSNITNDNIGNIFDIISILLGYENLMENRQQSAENNVNRSNQKQAKQILDKLHEEFNMQNKMLGYQNTLLKEILILLKGEK